uniref:Uncharacterized protein n=1 Tax=Romanomermis culicivorax TaxID=13658 RepID=A0A915KM70_ROMCU
MLEFTGFEADHFCDVIVTITLTLVGDDTAPTRKPSILGDQTVLESDPQENTECAYVDHFQQLL